MDDEFEAPDSDEFKAHIQDMAPDPIVAIIPAQEQGIEWGDLDDGKKRILLSEAYDHLKGPEQEAAFAKIKKLPDAPSSLHRFHEFFSPPDGIEYVEMSPDTWRRTRDVLTDEQALFIFDLNLGDTNRDGASELSVALKAHPRAFGILFSVKFKDKPEAWETELKQICKDHDLDSEKLVPLGKEKLRPAEFIYRFQLALLAKPFARFKDLCSSAIAAASNSSLEILKDFRPADTAEIIFRTSFEEGEWPPFTLHRVHKIYLDNEVLRVAKVDEIHKVVNEIQGIVSIKKLPHNDQHPRIYELEHDEYFVEPEILSQAHLPLEIGDIFETTEMQPRRYMLLAQPCDLRLRETGRGAVERGFLVEILDEKPKDEPGLVTFVQLRGFDKKGKLVWVAFRKSMQVNFRILDLTVYHPEGKAAFDVNTTIPSGLSSPLRKQHARIYDDVKKSVRDLASLEERRKAFDAIPRHLRTRMEKALMPWAEDWGDFSGTPTASGFEFKFKRIARLKIQFASVVLQRFHEFASRDAPERPFTDSIPPTDE